MADPIQALTDKLDALISALAPLTKFVDEWTLKEQRPGQYRKLPAAQPWRPFANRCEIIAIGVADAFSNSLSVGYYHIIADSNCFIALNAQAEASGYPVIANLVYGPIRISDQDVLHVIANGAGGGSLRFCPVE